MGAIFLAHAPSLFKAVVIIAPYASPQASPEDRAQEGHGVAAAAASGSRITVVYSRTDECLARPNLANEIQISRFGLRFNLLWAV